MRRTSQLPRFARGALARGARVPIRVRVTMVFAVALAIVLVGIGSFLYLRFRSGLDASIDQALRTRAGDVSALVQQADQGLRSSNARSLSVRGEAFAQILTADGVIFDSTPLVGAGRLLGDEQIRRALGGPLLVELPADGRFAEGARLLAVPVNAQGQRLVAVVGVSLAARTAALGQLAQLLLIGGVAGLILVCAAGYVAVAAALRPIESMRIHAGEISGGDPGARLPVPAARDEVARLGETLNEMLARIDRSLTHERAFVADASHELRTPLGILKTELELALRSPRSAIELEAAVRSAAAETDRVVQLADDLLVLAGADRRGLPLRLERLDLESVLRHVGDRFARRATQLGRPLEVDGRSRRPVRADPARLGQAIGNLIDNALRYGDGPISVSVVERAEGSEIHVRDRGAGLEPGFATVAFDRFTRGDPGRGAGGTGLGLAIVAAIAAAHGGRAQARNPDGGGADFWIWLPYARSPTASVPAS